MALRLPAFLKRTEPGVWVSATAHGAILVAALAAFAAPPMPPAEEGIPVEVMTENQFQEMTKGSRDGQKPTPDAKPRVDRVAEKVEQKEPGEAKQDVPSPPQRPPEMKTAEVEEPPPPPTPPLRPALEQPQSVSVPTPPDRQLEAKQQEAARAEAAQKAAERAEKAAEAKAEAQRREAAAKEMAKLVERQEAEAEARAKAKADEARAKAEEAKAEAKKVAEAKARAEEAKARAEAKAKADAEARAEMQRKVAEAEAKADAEAKAAEAKVAAEKAKAEAKKVADAKAAAAKARADAEAKARAKAELAAKFDAGAIGALVSQKPSQSTGATGREVQRVAAAGVDTGTAQKLSASQREGIVSILQAQIEKCYVAPPGAAAGIVQPVLDIRLNPDGSFTTDPRLMRGGASAVDVAIAQAALRAVRRCAPYRIPAQFAPFYNDWKTIIATFDLPRA